VVTFKYIYFFIVLMNRNISHWNGQRTATPWSRALLGAGALALLIGTVEYADLPSPLPSDKGEMGRAKNAVATVLASAVQEHYREAWNRDVRGDYALEKTFWPDAKVTGYTDHGIVGANVDLLFSGSDFVGTNAGDRLQGSVRKSEMDWNVSQTSDEFFHIRRWGYKFDYDLELRMRDGQISGVLIRPGAAFDWKITGSYDDKGNVVVQTDAPLTLDVTLRGTVR